MHLSRCLFQLVKFVVMHSDEERYKSIWYLVKSGTYLFMIIPNKF